MQPYKMTVRPHLDGYRVNISEYDRVVLDYRLCCFYDYHTEQQAQSEGQVIVDLMNSKVKIV